MPSAEALEVAAKAAAGKDPPPVHLWNPPFCGDLDIEIRRDGSWFYLGTPIGRPALVRLFASILKREGGRHYLVTPVEKVGIRVEDAPFLAVDAEVSGEGRAQALTFTTNLGDRATAGPEHPLRVARDPASGAPVPYVDIRRGLEARVDRKTFYRLVELGRHESCAMPGAGTGPAAGHARGVETAAGSGAGAGVEAGAEVGAGTIAGTGTPSAASQAPAAGSTNAAPGGSTACPADGASTGVQGGGADEAAGPAARWFGLWSGGRFFPLAASAECDEAEADGPGRDAAR